MLRYVVGEMVSFCVRNIVPSPSGQFKKNELFFVDYLEDWGSMFLRNVGKKLCLSQKTVIFTKNTVKIFKSLSLLCCTQRRLRNLSVCHSENSLAAVCLRLLAFLTVWLCKFYKFYVMSAPLSLQCFSHIRKLVISSAGMRFWCVSLLLSFPFCVRLVFLRLFVVISSSTIYYHPLIYGVFSFLCWNVYVCIYVSLFYQRT